MNLTILGKSQCLTATQVNFMDSPLCCVNIYRCHSNGASDTNFLPPGVKLERWLNLLPTEEDSMFVRLKRINTNCVSEGW